MLSDIFRLDEKIIIITGATGLLGRKHAEAIACYGGTPILLDLSKSKVNALAKEINEKYSSSSLGFEVDITDENAIQANVEMLISIFGKIDGLVNNTANNPKV